MSGLAIPEPQTAPLVKVREFVSLAPVIREEIRAAGDLPLARELHRRLEAFRRYVHDRKTRDLLDAEARLTEMLIGDLLPPAEETQGTRTDLSPASEKFTEVPKDDRYRFRLLAEHREEVEDLLAEGVTSRRAVLRALQQPRARAPEPDGAVRVDLRCGDFREVLADLPDESVDLILTDPPYPREFLHLYGELARFASRVLRDGGQCAVMVGHTYLPEVLQELCGADLEYRWLLAYLLPGGQSAQQWYRKVNTFWKPVVLLAKGEPNERWFGDVAKSKVNDNNQRADGWGQSESGFADLLDRLVEPGYVVCDPFAGSGTTALAARAGHCNFIGAELDAERHERAISRLGRS